MRQCAWGGKSHKSLSRVSLTLTTHLLSNRLDHKGRDKPGEKASSILEPFRDATDLASSEAARCRNAGRPVAVQRQEPRFCKRLQPSRQQGLQRSGLKADRSVPVEQPSSPTCVLGSDAKVCFASTLRAFSDKPQGANSFGDECGVSKSFQSAAKRRADSLAPNILKALPGARLARTQRPANSGLVELRCDKPHSAFGIRRIMSPLARSFKHLTQKVTNPSSISGALAGRIYAIGIARRQRKRSCQRRWTWPHDREPLKGEPAPHEGWRRRGSSAGVEKRGTPSRPYLRTSCWRRLRRRATRSPEKTCSAAKNAGSALNPS